jgi:hypothetical protein
VPQAGEQGPLVSDKLQATPLLVGSLCTTAWKVMAALPVLTALILFVMVTVSATTVKLSLSDFVVSLTEVATKMGVSKGGPLSLLGGV